MKSEIEELFSMVEAYQTILLDGDIVVRFAIPEPKTKVLEYKCLYICQRIFQKIEGSINLSFQ